MRISPPTPAWLRVSIGFFAALSIAPGAHAALTSSEKAVVTSFVQKGEPSTAARVRALVARPDLSPEEIAEPLRKGYAGAPFDERHGLFTEALIGGPGSAASRNALAPAVVEALLERASSRLGDVPATASSKLSPKGVEAA